MSIKPLTNIIRALVVLTILMSALISESLSAEIYTPPGYSEGQSLGGSGFGLDMGILTLEDDYYLTLRPSLSFSIWRLGIGLQVPLELLLYDSDPKGTLSVGDLREGTYDSKEDFIKIIDYVRYGTHNFYDPDALFSWSVYFGKMNDGYIGHKTIVNRYVTSYDPTVYHAGLMADINNNWGGVEVFKSDAFRTEVTGVRGYIRPVHWIAGVRNLLFANNTITNPRTMVAMTNRDARDPSRNGGIYFQETVPDQGKGGRLEQYLYRPLKEDYKPESQGDVQFEEVVDPVTGEVEVRAIESEDKGRSGGEEPQMVPGSSTESSISTPGGGEEPVYTDEEEEPGDPWTSGWWARWAIGYSVVSDKNAPLTLETDGSGDLVIDPDTKLPRTDKSENLTFVGMDTELRLSPFRWLELTPYADYNRIKDLDNAKATHVGLDMGFTFTETLKFTFRPEYRKFSSNYIPQYFDSYYALERTRYNPNGNVASNGVTKLSYLKSLPVNGPETKGYVANFLLEWTEIFVVELVYEDYEGENNSRSFVGLYVPEFFGFFVNGYFEKKQFNSFSEAFDKNENTMMAGELGYNFFGGVYIKATLYRTWTLDKSTSSYVPNDEVVYGFGFSSDL